MIEQEMEAGMMVNMSMNPVTKNPFLSKYFEIRGMECDKDGAQIEHHGLTHFDSLVLRNVLDSWHFDSYWCVSFSSPNVVAITQGSC